MRNCESKRLTTSAVTSLAAVPWVGALRKLARFVQHNTILCLAGFATAFLLLPWRAVAQTLVLSPPFAAAEACFDAGPELGTVCDVHLNEADIGGDVARGKAFADKIGASAVTLGGSSGSFGRAVIPFSVNENGNWFVDLKLGAVAQATTGASADWDVDVGVYSVPMTIVAGTGQLPLVGISGPEIGGSQIGGIFSTLPRYRWLGREGCDHQGCSSGFFFYDLTGAQSIPAVSDDSPNAGGHGDRLIDFPLEIVGGAQYVVMVNSVVEPAAGGLGAAMAIVDPVLTVDPRNPNVMLNIGAPLNVNHETLLTSSELNALVAKGIDPGRLTRVGIELPTAQTVRPITSAAGTPGPNGFGWNSTDVAVTLTATDSGGPGVKAINYTLSGAETVSGSIVGASGTIPITGEGVTTVTYFAQDTAGNKEAPKTLILQIDKTPPTISAALAPTPNANGWNNSNVTVQFTATDSLSGVATVSSPVALSNEGKGQIVSGTAVDRAGNTASLNVTANIDKTPPVIFGLPASGCTLWPPNHQLLQVANVMATDALSGLTPGSFQVTGTSNEAVNATGSGNTSPDVLINGGSVQVRAERSGSGTGRVYTINATATDLAGNVANASGNCVVPHDQGGGE